MSDPHDPKTPEFDPRLVDDYRRASAAAGEAPGPEVRAAVLAAAARAVDARPQYAAAAARAAAPAAAAPAAPAGGADIVSRMPHRRVPLAIAATLVLSSIAVLLATRVEEQDRTEREQAMSEAQIAATPVPAAPTMAPQGQAAPDQAPVAAAAPDLDRADHAKAAASDESKRELSRSRASAPAAAPSAAMPAPPMPAAASPAPAAAKMQAPLATEAAAPAPEPEHHPTPIVAAPAPMPSAPAPGAFAPAPAATVAPAPSAPAPSAPAATAPAPSAARRAAPALREAPAQNEARTREEAAGSLSSGVGAAADAAAPETQKKALAKPDAVYAHEDDPPRWIEHIKRLRAAGRDREADVQVQRFRARYPEIVLPPQALRPLGTQ